MILNTPKIKTYHLRMKKFSKNLVVVFQLTSSSVFFYLGSPRSPRVETFSSLYEQFSHQHSRNIWFTFHGKKVMDDILNRCVSLQLLERERAEVIIDASVIESNRVLAGKFFTKRHVNLESVARVLRSIWKTNQSFEVNDLGDNKALFLFQNEDDADKV